MATKLVNLKTATTQDVVRTLTSGLELISVNYPMLIDLHDLSLNGIALTEKEVIHMIQTLRDCVEFSVFRGHIASELGSVSYTDQRYFTYERIDNSIRSNDLKVMIKYFDSFTFFVSENNWIDFHFMKSDGTCLTMVFVP